MRPRACRALGVQPRLQRGARVILLLAPHAAPAPGRMRPGFHNFAIGAAPREEQKYFLATKQADEARHAVLFGRFMREVAGQGRDMDSSLRATRPE